MFSIVVSVMLFHCTAALELLIKCASIDIHRHYDHVLLVLELIMFQQYILHINDFIALMIGYACNF